MKNLVFKLDLRLEPITDEYLDYDEVMERFEANDRLVS